MHVRYALILACACYMSPTKADRARSLGDAFWEVIDNHRHSTAWVQLHAVNNFVNRAILYRSDLDQYGEQDHWAGPLELMKTGAGDCEDYALAKYAALRAMGVPDEQLRLVYTRHRPSGQPHMVLHYTADGSLPLVLDNIASSIQSTNERIDLRIIYSFNTRGIWLPEQDTPFPPMRNARWMSILKEIHDNLLNIDATDT